MLTSVMLHASATAWVKGQLVILVKKPFVAEILTRLNVDAERNSSCYQFDKLFVDGSLDRRCHLAELCFIP